LFHGSQTGIRGGWPTREVWQAERLPYNSFHCRVICRASASLAG
jgi:hypothetical protein